MEEDLSCQKDRAARLAQLAAMAPSAEFWVFPGGLSSKRLLEESRYSFVYGQFIASAVLGFAYVEHTLAAIHYASGRNDLQRASSQLLFQEAWNAGILSDDDLKAFDSARRLRNPLVHFRPPHDPESYEMVEAVARQILAAAFRLLRRNAV